MTELQPHRYIKAVRVGKDEESGEPVTIITTDVNINRESPSFDAAAFDEIQKHVETWQRKRHVRVTIEGPV